MKPFKLEDAEAAELRKRERTAGPSADVHFAICVLCGYPTWICTRNDGTGKTTAEVGERPCQSCEAFASRQPDVFEFVWAVVRAHPMRERALGSLPDGGAGQEKP